MNNPGAPGGIPIWNRARKKMEMEKVYGEGPMRAFYGNPMGRAITSLLLAKPWLSRSYGALQDSPKSQKKIAPFIDTFAIPMQEFEARSYASFNDFFTRKFIPGARSFVEAPNAMPAFCEGRYLAFSKVEAHAALPVKGVWLEPAQLLQKPEWISKFSGGPAFIARLCPVDYHRFHFPDAGKKLDRYALRGPLHSVNPIALQTKPDILFTNERVVSILDSKNFGLLAYIEVGAMMVGKIVESHSGESFQRGEEKGYFLFGASTVILLGEPGRWLPAEDLLEQSASGTECLVALGSGIAQKI